MDQREILRKNADRLHTTEMGMDRIRKNLRLQAKDVMAFCRNIILDPACAVRRQGKNFYCQMGNIQLTVNASSYTVITAHLTE